MTAAKILICLSFLLPGRVCLSQTNIDSLLGKIDPQKFAASVSDKVRKLEDKLMAKSMKTLNSLQQQEEKLYNKLLRTKDSLRAKIGLTSLKDKYAALKSKLKSPAIVGITKQYIPKLDSLSTSLKFLNANGVNGKIKDALSKTASLQDKFQKAEEIKQFIRERKEQLKQQLEKFGMVKQLKKINKQVYYYAQQINEYKTVLNDPKKIEKKAIELLSKTKFFQEFMRKNSMLASLFRMPSDPTDPTYMTGFAGLQTRAQVNGLIQQQMAIGGPIAQAQFRENLQMAQSQLNQLKDKLMKTGGGNTDAIMPEGFKPNDQKTKSFFKRLEYGTNLQTQKATGYFPVTSDMGFSVGYKLNDKSILGIGGSYKLGLGRGWNAIKFSSEGIGLRSFIDWKIKRSLWFSGGYEMNHKAAFSNFSVLQNLNAWQQSGLIGVSKKIAVKTKFFKQTKLMLLWDFLSYQQVPRTQAIVFRIGYNLK